MDNSNKIVNKLDMMFRLDGWLPITEYFNSIKSGIELDWVLLLCVDQTEYQMTDPSVIKGEMFMPIIGEYRKFKTRCKDNGWYDTCGEKIDYINHPIYFKPINNRPYESVYKETLKIDDKITLKEFSTNIYPKFIKKVTGKYMEKIKEY